MVKKLREQVENKIIEETLLEKGQQVVVGFSGGPDSVCLLHLLIQMRDKWDLDLHAVHINHNLRPGYADVDQAYAENFCQEHQVAFYAYSCQADIMAKERGITTEEAGRQARYEAFEEVRGKLGGTGKIAVAHNLNDQAETILMRLLRGTGPDGLAAMEYERQGGIIRPLLDVSRQEIEDYCEALDLKPRIDLTNLEPMYVRNKIRLELIPYLEENYNNNIMSALVRLGTIAKADRDYFQKLIQDTQAALVERISETENRIDIEGYKGLDPAVAKRLINQSLKDIGMDRDITAYHLDEAHKMIGQGQVGDQMDFPLGFKLALSYDKAILYKEEKKAQLEEGFSYKFNIEGTTEIPELGASIQSKITSAPVKDRPEGPAKPRLPDYQSVGLDLDKISDLDKLVLRTRKPGDYIRPLGMKGRKKIQDYFVDKKVPRENRNEIPLLCIEDEVIWVPGLGLNNNYKIIDETKKILRLEIIYPL